MTPTEASEIVTILANGWESPAVSAETQALWSDLIEDLDAATTRAIALRIVQTADRRPPISELRKLVAAETAAAETGTEQFLDPEEAWGMVQQAFGSVGRYRTFPDTHPLVAEAVSHLGWEEMCASENLEATRAHFMRVYDQVLSRARDDSAATFGARPVMPSGSGLSRIERAGGLTRIGEVALSALGFRKAEGAS